MGNYIFLFDLNSTIPQNICRDTGESSYCLDTFLRDHRKQCYIVTENPNIKNSLPYDRDIVQTIDKVMEMECFPSSLVFINAQMKDVALMEKADIVIGYHGGGCVVNTILKHASYAFYREDTLCQFLERLL